MAVDNGTAMEKAIRAGRSTIRPIPHPYPRDKIAPDGKQLDLELTYTYRRNIEGVIYTYHDVPVVSENGVLLLDPTDPKILITAVWADGKD